jgi:hypothetical protein
VAETRRAKAVDRVTTSGGVPQDAPTTGVTRVRVRPEGKGHHHHATPPVIPAGTPRPEWLLVMLPPERPNAETICDTEWLWQVPAEEVARLGGDASRGRAFVCCHQVEID